MAPIAQPVSFSVYRGQSRTGVGEGPGKTVLHGEQYLRVSPPLYDAELLESIRPWMTLDSDPADHQRLNDQLEAWSLFPAGEYLFVVRLVSAGIYDRRAAYFAHGRAWKRDTIPPGLDPGLHLGRSEVFDPPWRDERPPLPVPEDRMAPVRIEQVKAESQTAARYLAHLLQAMTEGYALIVAAPVADFAIGGALHALIDLARGGLPLRLQRSCRIRVYSQFPELFLRHLGANLVVVPEEAAAGALTARPTATLIDRQGKKIAGKEVNDRMLGYATAVVERAIAIPDGLTYFSERMREVTAGDARAVQVTYNLAFAFAGPRERRVELLRHLPRTAEKLGPGLHWNELIGDHEWREFPPEALLDELLIDTNRLSAARRELLRAAEVGAARLGMHVDARLPEWWDAHDPGKLARLIELLAHEPALVTDEAAAERTASIPLEQLMRAGSPRRVLQAEARSGRLAQRSHEVAQLARAAADERVLDLLSRAVSKDHFDPEWARTFVRTAPSVALGTAAQRWLGDPVFFLQAWGDVPALLLDRLRSMENPPAALVPAITTAAARLKIASDPENYLRLADLLTRIDRSEGRDPENALVMGLWKALPSLTNPGQRLLLERTIFDPAWCCIELSRIPLRILLELAAGFENERNLDLVYADLDERIKADVELTTEVLVRTGWWYFWRRRSRLHRANHGDASVLERSALTWLGSPFWTEGRGAEATLEAWELVLSDLPDELTGAQLERLRSGTGAPRWPWIPPFEDAQFAALIDRAADLGGLAELAEAASFESGSVSSGETFHASVLSRSRFKDQLPTSALAWLVDTQSRGSRPELTYPEAAYLHEHAGHRAQRARAAVVHTVARILDDDTNRALRLADDAMLWSEPGFLSRVADWMSRKGSLAAIDLSAARMIDDSVDGVPDRRPHNPPQHLIRDLVQNDLQNAARLLHPEISENLHSEQLADAVIAALVKAQSGHKCWQQFALKIDAARTNAGQHPIGGLAERIHKKALSAAERGELAKSGWSTFVDAASTHRTLLSALVNDRAIEDFYGFASAMLRPGSMGTAAVQLAFALVNPEFRTDTRWWQGLVRAMRSYRRHRNVSSADDREDVAIALVFSHLDEPAERRALEGALRHDWEPLAAEFGERVP